MTRTITAMFDSRSEAESARSNLSASNIDANRVRIIDKSSASQAEPGGEGGGFWSTLKDAFMPDEDRYSYEEGVRRGGYLLCAQVEENQADEAIRILNQSNSVDFEQREQEWRKEGWSAYEGRGSTGFQAEERSQQVEEEHIPLVEEQLKVGKREISRGGARVRSYIEETPVHDQVTLREEHVDIERRPVNETLSTRDLNESDLLRERNVEMTEMSEEAVVAKEARVKEEVVVRKTAEEHVENIDDTVRRTEVEIDEGTRGAEHRSAFSSLDQNRQAPDPARQSPEGTTGDRR
jgi:uncharacterized protein (TIGR02271 family)